MGYGIIFRNEKDICYFRRIIIELIKNKEISSVLLTYPYFYENKPYDKKVCDSAGKENYIKTEAKYSILNDGLLDAILERRNDKFAIGTISSKENDSYWCESYKKFVKRLRNEVEGSNIKYVPYWGTSTKNGENKWHSKIAMFFKGMSLVGIMIGSSNMTNRAFKEGINNFNLESDIIVWRDDIIKNTMLDIQQNIQKEIDEHANKLGLIFCISDEELNKDNSEDIVINEFKKRFLEIKNKEDVNINDMTLDILESVQDINRVEI